MKSTLPCHSLQRDGPTFHVVTPSDEAELIGAFGPQGSDDGAGQLQIGDEGNARIDGTAPDFVALRTTLLIVFPGNVDDEVDAAVIDEIKRADPFAGLLFAAGRLANDSREASKFDAALPGTPGRLAEHIGNAQGGTERRSVWR